MLSRPITFLVKSLYSGSCKPVVPVIAGMLIYLLSTPVMAEWSGGIEGGAILRDEGNATRIRLRLDNNTRPLTHSLFADWIRADDESNSYEAGYIPRYWFNKSLYTFGEALFRVDKPFNIEQESQFLAGLGYKLLSSDTQSLWAEVGTGYRTTEFRNNQEQDETLVVARGGYHQILSQLFKFELDVKSTHGETVTDSSAEAAVSVFVGSGYIKYGYRTRRLSQDEQATLTDSDSFVSFNYGF